MVFLLFVSPAIINAQDANITFPPAANVLDITQPPYNADNSGSLDATAAIQNALNNAIANQIVYLPNGTYLISNTLTTPRKNRVQLQGQNKENTIIKLINNAPNFQNKNAMFVIGEPNHGQSFFNELRNLTFHTGNGNPGAVGVHYAANNQGSLRHVKIISGDGTGAVGLDLTAGTNGPCFVYDVHVTGFDIGIENASYHSITLEKIELSNQNTIGILNNVTGNGLTIYNLTSNNTVMAIDNLKTMTLIGASFTNGASDVPAIKNKGCFYGRNISRSGYNLTIRNNAGHHQDAAEPTVAEYNSQSTEFTFPSPVSSLNLPIHKIPEVPWGDPNSFDWGNVWDYVLPGDGNDITNALQAAIDAGHKTVYIPASPGGNNTVNLSGTVYVRNNCERIISCGAEFGYGNVGKIEVINGTANTVIIERLRGAYTKIEYVHNTSRTVVFSSFPTGFGNVPFVSNGSGDLHIIDIPGQFHFNNSNQHIWCRQINPEGDFKGIINKGATLWILGIKTEGGATKISTSDGGKTELLGGQVFTNVPFTRLDGTNDYLVENIFEVDNSSFSFAGIHRRLANTDRSPYKHWVKETRGSETRYMDTDSSTYDEPIGLFVANAVASTALPASPNGLIASSSNNLFVDLSWNENANNEFGYELQRSTSAGFTEDVRSHVMKENLSSFWDQAASYSTTYYYRVRTFNSLGYSAWSNTVNPTTNAYSFNPEGDLNIHWKFNETSGTLAKDASGNAQDGRLYYGLLFGNNSTDGKEGKALQFNGTDHRVSMSRTLERKYPRTLSAWVKFTHTDNDVVAFIGDAGKYNAHLAIAVNNGKAELKAGNGTSYSITGSTAINDNNWHQLVGVFVNDSVRHLYVDGILEASGNTKISAPYINRFTVGALEFRAFLAGAFSSVHTGYTGTGYIGLKYDGQWVGWNEVYAQENNTYTLTFRYLNGNSVSRACDIIVNGVVAANLIFPPTGGWTEWGTVSCNVPMNSGENKVHLIYKPTGTNHYILEIDKMEVDATGEIWQVEDFSTKGHMYSGAIDDVRLYNKALSAADVSQLHSFESGTLNVIPGKLEAEDYKTMSGIRTQNTSDDGVGMNVGWINAGDWMDYEVNVTVAGNYTVEYRVASPKSTGQVQLQLGSTTLVTTNIPNTGNWQTWATVAATVYLNAGIQMLRVYASGSDWNINWINFISSPVAQVRTITATTGANGTISPAGNIVIDEGGNQTLTITPNAGFVIQDVLVDGISVGAITSYTFNNVVANHSITATFTAAITTLPNVTIATYLFNASLNSSDTDPNTTAGNFSDGPGITGGTSYFGGGRTVNQTVLTQFIGNSIANEDYFEFTVTPGTAVSMDLATLTFRVKRAGTSPDKLRVYNSADNYSAYKEISITGSWIAHSWDLTNFEKLTEAVTFRFYVFGNNSGGADPTRIVYIDEVTLTGDISVKNLSASLRNSHFSGDFTFENHDESNNAGVMVYPNPVQNGIIKVDGLNEGAVVSIYDMRGVKLFEKVSKSQLLEIKIKDWTRGILMIVVNNNNTISSHKVCFE